jgi:LL-diaminopimelate aminotransferase
MVKLNHHYAKLSAGYLFPEIQRRGKAFQEKNLEAILIDLGIGDIKQPLAPSIAKALEEGAREMGASSTFKGYGPAQGYLFLREAIIQGDYAKLGIHPDEVFVSDGAKNDIANLQEIFDVENRVALPNPTYPVYIDTNVMAGRTRPALKMGGYGGVIYLPCNESNDFMPEIPNRSCDLIYLCSPNNPTGAALDRKTLASWVKFAKAQKAIILFDGAYEAYIRSKDAPRSIYEIEGAKEVAIEIRSFSKTAGFTGLRCSYTVVPHALKIKEAGQTVSLHALWKRRHETKFGGVPYPIQKAAAAAYSEPGRTEIKAQIDGYLENAQLLRKGLTAKGYKVFGGKDAPYLWVKAKKGLTSWEFFDALLEKAHLLSVPGSGFGSEGEGYVRLSAFGDKSEIQQAIERLR